MTKKTKQTKRVLPKIRKSVFFRILRTFLTMVVVLIAALSLVSYLFLKTFIENEYVGRLSSLAASAEEKLQLTIQESRTITAEMASSLFWEVEELAGEERINAIDEVLERNAERHAALVASSFFDSQGQRLAGKGKALQELGFFPERTVLIPVISRTGWSAYDVVSPLPPDKSGLRSWLNLRFDAQSLMSEISSSARGLGKTGVVMLGGAEDGELITMKHGFEGSTSFAVNIGNVEELLADSRPIALATMGNEGIGKAVDYNGNTVLVASRYLPDLGWGLVVKIDQLEALQGANELANMLLLIGILFICAAAVITYSMTRQLTKPLIDMSEKMSKLGPDNWRYHRSVFTGDELENLDDVVKNLTSRLLKVYEDQEAVIAERTEQLKEEFAKDHAILKSLSIGLIVVDPEGFTQEMNLAAERILKVKSKKAKGVSVTELVQLTKDHKSVAPEENPITLCLENQENIKISPDTHLDIIRQDGSHVAIRLSVSPLVSDGKTKGAIILFQDVTTERQLDYMKTEFITLASHQLRTPLSTVQWYLELLGGDDDNLTDDQKAFIVELRLAARRMSNIVGELMDASRLQKGGVEPVLKTVDLNQFVESITAEMKGMGAERKIACISSIPSESVLLKSDPMLLSIVMQNLLSNAIKYSHERGKVQVALTQTGSDVVIRIKDKGIGIPHADQDHVFEKLYRAHNARKLDVNGSGLGLYSTKNIVEQLGGTISFESEEDKGTTFIISFPNTRLVKGPRLESDEEDKDQ